MEGKYLVACYGSLKKGHYNHGGLGEDKEFLGTTIVDAVMYSNGSYPKLYKPCPAGVEDERFDYGKQRNHVVEIYRINETAFGHIDSMEVGAGYTPEVIETQWGPATIYWMPHEHFSKYDKWVEEYTDGKVSE